MRAVVHAIERRTKLPVRALAAFSGGLAALAIAAVGFAVVAHAVTSGNRIAASDPVHLRWFYRTDAIAEAARFVSQLGAVSVLVPLGALAGLILWSTGVRLVVAAAPLIALLTAGTATLAIKGVIARQSPAVAKKWAYSTVGSFPSGHAADSSALFVALALVIAVAALRRPLTRLAVLVVGFGIPAAVGLSQLVLAVHWPTDVVAGWGLGSGLAILTVLATLGSPLAHVRGHEDADRAGGGLRALAVRPTAARQT